MMGPSPEELGKMHARFAAACFNRAWNGIDKATRTPEEDEDMLSAAHASFWHWSQREDLTPQNRSVAYWQLSRVYALSKLPALPSASPSAVSRSAKPRLFRPSSSPTATKREPAPNCSPATRPRPALPSSTRPS